ncbi:DUF551 domain-containing protein [Parabacteroides distasonis]|jgi:hypothetical protein|uniref:DUF551 domain-containing protein n=1 Tax=Parabacteroides distasonis TaxID=823 RepID=UPI00356159D0
MERNIDMGQTVEEAAHLFAESRSSGSAFPAYYQGFIAGAEWQAKQSPWISVKDRLPPPGEEVLLFDINSIRHLVLGWLRENKGYNKSMWALSNGHVDDEDITHWMIIPKNHG